MKSAVGKPKSKMLLADLRQLIAEARQDVARQVDSTSALLYWRVGQRIRRDILKEKRAEYGQRIVSAVGRELTAESGQGFSEKNLWRMVQFAQVFPDEKIVVALIRQLSWTHFLRLIPIEDPLMRELENFILELGVGFTFVARQKRIQVDNDDYYLDLLFYHRGLRRLVAIDLKLGEFQPGDKGQMELYLRWLAKHDQQPGEEPPIGLILCAGKKTEQIELLELEKSGIRVASYWTEMLPKKLLQRKLHEAIRHARERQARREPLLLEGGKE